MVGSPPLVRVAYSCPSVLSFREYLLPSYKEDDDDDDVAGGASITLNDPGQKKIQDGRLWLRGAVTDHRLILTIAKGRCSASKEMSEEI